MDADRELDALVAEKVMGWADFWRSDGFLYGYPPNEQVMGIDGERAPVPCYSTDMAAAWSVLEELKTRGYTATIFVYGIGVQVRIETGGSVVALVEYQTAPLAICNAALKALQIV